jgi:hypothetical protein
MTFMPAWDDLRSRPSRSFTLAAAAYRTTAEAAGNQGSFAVTVPMDCPLIGRWRIVEADLWDRADLDLLEPATTSATRRS